MFEHMVNMAKTPQEMEDASVPQPLGESIYPYGLSLTLGNEELEKLGLDCSDEECEIGSYLHLHALAEVTGIHKTDTGDGKKICLNIQITHLELESEDAENNEADDEIGEGHIYRAAGQY